MHSIKDIIPPRPLTQKEKEFLNRLLSEPFLGREAIMEQMTHALVSGECTCGCPSIILTVNRSLTDRAEVRRRIPIEAEGLDSDGMPIHLLLHVVDGFLSELEIYREDSGKILSLPEPDTLNLINLDDEEH